MSGRSAKRGVTLVEIILSLGLLSLILGTVGKITATGYDYYWRSLGSLDVQRAALTANRRLTEELSLSSIHTVIVEPGAIAFATPLDSNGKIQYTESGNLQWTSHVCYYLDTVQGASVIIRKRTDMSTPGVNPIRPTSEGHSISWFQGQSGGEVVARDVVVFDFELQADVVDITVTGSKESRGDFEMTVRNSAFPRN